MSTRYEKSRLGDLLVEMKIVDAASVESALAERQKSGLQIASILAARGVVDEDRLTRAVAARLGLEAVSLASLRIHGRVLAQVPATIARARCVLPIAIKRTAQAELLYLVMCDPLDQQAIAEVQNECGKQVRVLMAAATELVQVIDKHYSTAPSGPVEAPSTTPPPMPPPMPRAPSVVSEEAPAAMRPPPDPYDPSNPPTLTDSERPPELDALFERLRRQEGRPGRGVAAQPLPDPRTHPQDDRVQPSELDARETLNTFIDLPPEAKTGAEPAGTGEWDRAAQRLSEGPSVKPPPSPPPATKTPPPVAPSTTGLVLSEDSSEPAPSVDEPAPASPWAADDLSQPGGMPQEEGEDIATTTFELSQLAAAEVRGKRPGSSPPSFVDALELPVEPENNEHPFHGPPPSSIPVGLDKTGIFPAVDLGGESFDPPPLSETQRPVLAGHSDIPESDAAVQARFAQPEQRSESDDIEEIVEVPVAQGGERPSAFDIPILEPSNLLSVPDAPAVVLEATKSDTPPPEVASEAVVELTEEAAVEEPTPPASLPALPPLPPPPASEPVEEAPPPPVVAAPEADEPLAHGSGEPITDGGVTSAPTTDSIPIKRVASGADESEEPTPAKDSVDRSDVLAALEDNFLPQDMESDVDESTNAAVDERRVRAEATVRRLRAVESLTSAERAEVLLAVTRLCLDRGVFSPEDLINALLADP